VYRVWALRRALGGSGGYGGALQEERRHRKFGSTLSHHAHKPLPPHTQPRCLHAFHVGQARRGWMEARRGPAVDTMHNC